MSDDETEAALADAYEAGLAHEKAGRLDAAEAAFREALRLDPADRCGASVRLAGLGRAPAPDTAPPAYVVTLFDQHADVFDAMLVDDLGYDAPLRARAIAEAALETAGRPRFERLLDLGCGTGLVGEALRDRVVHATGVDLSTGMLEIAAEKEVYDDLYEGDVTGFLEQAAAEGEAWDLIIATDVLPYLGALEAFAAGLAACAAPGALLILTTETLPIELFESAPYRVSPSHRFAHREAYVRDILGAAGCDAIEAELIVIRADGGAGAPGHLLSARRKS